MSKAVKAEEILEGETDLAWLAGAGGGVLRALEEASGGRLGVRGDKVLLEGAAADVERARAFLRELARLREGGAELQPSDVRHAGRAFFRDGGDVASLFGVLEKLQDYVEGVFNTLQSKDGQQSGKLLLDRFRNQRLLEDLATASYDASRGGSVQGVLRLADQLKDPRAVTEVEYVTDDLTEILDESVKKPGLRWRLGSLNRSLGSLRRGDFGFVFARPETGKTTFLASEVTHMAGQLKEEDGPILWFTNEEAGKKVKLRCYQAALGARIDHLLKAPDRAKGETRVAATRHANDVRMGDAGVEAEPALGGPSLARVAANARGLEDL